MSEPMTKIAHAVEVLREYPDVAANELRVALEERGVPGVSVPYAYDLIRNARKKLAEEKKARPKREVLGRIETTTGRRAAAAASLTAPAIDLVALVTRTRALVDDLGGPATALALLNALYPPEG